MPNISISLAGSQVTDQVFTRIDKFEAYIDFTGKNYAFLSDPEKFWGLIDWTELTCWGTGGNVRPDGQEATPRWFYVVRRHSWQIIIRGAFAHITISLPRNYESLLPHERTGVVSNRYLSVTDLETVLPQLLDNPLPSMTQLSKSRRRYLGKIRFTDAFKRRHRPYHNQWHAFEYRRSIRSVSILWEQEYGIDLVPKTLEVAVDTWDRSQGRRLIKNFLPRSYNPAHLYHFDENCPTNNGRSSKISGPSLSGGNHEYSSYSKCGRRVNHSYVKQVGIWDRELYRVETQFHRTFLREYCRRRGITATADLLEQIYDLAAENIRFFEIDIKKLYAKFPGARKWKLRRLSTRGQIHLLQVKHEISRKTIGRYLVPIELAILRDQDL
jgi:hypothetical protein